MRGSPTSTRKSQSPCSAEGKRNRLARRLLSPMLTGPSTRRARRQHPFEDLHRLPHFVHCPERDAAVRLLERREISPDVHLERGARFTELARGTLQVDEDAVGVAVGRLVSQTLERLEREVAHAGVFRSLFFNVLRIPERGDSGCCGQGVDAAEAPGTGNRLDGLGLTNGVAE